MSGSKGNTCIDLTGSDDEADRGAQEHPHSGPVRRQSAFGEARHDGRAPREQRPWEGARAREGCEPAGGACSEDRVTAAQKSCSEDRVAAAQKQVQWLQEQLEKAKERAANSDSLIVAERDRVSKLQSDKESLRQTIKHLETRNEDLVEKDLEQVATNALLEARVKELEECVREKCRKNKDLELENTRTARQLGDMSAKLLDVEKGLAGERETARALHTTVQKLKLEAGELREQKQKAYEEGKREHERLEKQKDHSQAKNHQLELSKLRKEQARLDETLKEKGGQIMKIDKEKKDLQDEVKRIKHHEKMAKTKDEMIAKLKSENQKLKADAEMLPLLKEQIKKLQDEKNAGKPTTPTKEAQGSRRPQQCAKIARSAAHFGSVYHFGRGDPEKAQRADRPAHALPYDDAMGATGSCLVLCDGVGGGGAASGEWARECVAACLESSTLPGFSAQALPQPGTSQKNLASEIVVSAMKDLEKLSPGAGTSRLDGRATTTLLTLKLLSQTDEKGRVEAKIDACELGDSRWAYLRWDDSKGAYMCHYLAQAHVHDETRPPFPPFQIRHPCQKYGQPAGFYFGEKAFRKQIMSTFNLRLTSSSRDHPPIIVAGSDGLWDNILGEEAGQHEADEQTRRLKDKLAETVNDFLDHHPTVNKEFISALGGFFRMTVVNRMANIDCKHRDDVSIFVGTIEISDDDGKSSTIFDPRFFEGRLSHEEIQEGLQSFITHEDIMSGPRPQTSSRLPLASVPMQGPALSHSSPRGQHLGKRPGPADPPPSEKRIKR